MWTKEDINGKWAQTAWAKKLAAKATRAGLNDFQRFVVTVQKKKVCDVIRLSAFVCLNQCDDAWRSSDVKVIPSGALLIPTYALNTDQLTFSPACIGSGPPLTPLQRNQFIASKLKAPKAKAAPKK